MRIASSRRISLWSPSRSALSPEGAYVRRGGQYGRPHDTVKSSTTTSLPRYPRALGAAL